MATTPAHATTADGELRLARQTPEVARTASASQRFTVTFVVEGTGLLELQHALAGRVAGVGVDRVSRLGTTVSLHGVEQGREGEVFHEVQAAIDDVNRSRKAAREVSDQRRSATEEADAVSAAQLQAVRKGFASAAQAAASNGSSHIQPSRQGEETADRAVDACDDDAAGWRRSHREATNGNGF